MSERELPTTKWLEEARALKHEMSNILMGLVGHAELLEGYPELGERSREKVQLIREQLRRLEEQVEALNSLCR